MAPTIKVGQYILKKKIGEGAFAEVRLAVHADTGEEFAIKVFDRSALPRSDLERDVKREIKIMQYLRHPGIVSIHAALVTETKMYLVMELIRGGELYDEIVSKRRVDEKTARRYFHQIVDAMIYCHKRGVVHRDLKPENILLTDDGKIKITDFGMSWMKEAADIDGEQKGKELLKTQCGTAKYMAPETIVRSSAGYDGEKVDAWECGMVLYALLAGYLPFNGEDDNSVFQSILRGKLRFPSHFSPGAKDVLRRLLEKDPAKRATLPEIREHLWFIVDYKDDPSNYVQQQAARKSRCSKATNTISGSPTTTRNGNDSRTPRDQNGAIKHPGLPPTGGSTPGTDNIVSTGGNEKAKLGQSFKQSSARSKSRGRLSQKIRQGSLQMVQDNTKGEIPIVKPVPRPPATSQGVRFLGGTHPEDERTAEEIVDMDTHECTLLPDIALGGPNTETASKCHGVDVDMTSVITQDAESRATPSPTLMGISGVDTDSVGIRGKDATVTDRVAPSPLASPTNKKAGRHGGNGHVALKVPSLGVSAGIGMFFGSRDSTPDEGIPDVDDSPSSISGKRKGPLAGMLRSMLSIDKAGGSAVNMGPPLSEQSSWFSISSPVTDRAEGGVSVDASPFREEARDGDDSDSVVSSFKFRKRRVRVGHGPIRSRETAEIGSAGT